MKLLSALTVLLALVVATTFAETTTVEPVDGDTYGGGYGGGYYKCFHGENEVTTPSGNKMIKDLSPNEKILTMTADGCLKYEPVLLDIHHLPNEKAKFYEIYTGAHKVVVTEGHFLYIGETAENARLVPCDEVTLGDPLLVVSDPTIGVVGFERVRHIRTIRKTGLFNPIVPSGNLVVGGVVASVYADDIPPLTPLHSHQALWVARQINHVIPNVVDMMKVKGLPLWAHVFDVVRATLRE